MESFRTVFSSVAQAHMMMRVVAVVVAVVFVVFVGKMTCLSPTHFRQMTLFSNINLRIIGINITCRVQNRCQKQVQPALSGVTRSIF